MGFEIKAQEIHDRNTGVVLTFGEHAPVDPSLPSGEGKGDTVWVRVSNSRDGTSTTVLLQRGGDVLSMQPHTTPDMLDRPQEPELFASTQEEMDAAGQA
jgi:hypothetical protein